MVTKSIEDFFRGVRFLTGSLLAILSVAVAALFLVTGVLMWYTYGNPLAVVYGVGIAAVVVGVPYLLVRVGRYLR